ncbi:hypothetical protein IWQ57_001276 [Coemansia nantahalensis]|uniref:Uncharacterized protein n=1 Tax=Coemansia nantahalensis TaxID=2789366 RepID=A0ACC1K4Y7_9FUNG|nr:hypothetical protein IWQ57_001276 [Coemansia nantahalensis]
MKLRSLFYPDRKRDLRPNYRDHCGCDDCIGRAQAYGEHWRHKTPVCTCCDCMAIAGEDVPHTHSTYSHTHAASHTCAMTGPIQHRSHPTVDSCAIPHREPPPKYSLTPHTTHKVDDCCGARYYTTPLFPGTQPEPAHGCASVHPLRQQACECPPNGYNELIYLRTPGTYRPCNR